MNQPLRLLYIVSHPIQYQAPLLRHIASEPSIKLTVLFESMVTTGKYTDPGFGCHVNWDVPLTEGYTYHHVSSNSEACAFLRETDVLWVHGWNSRLKRSVISSAKSCGVPVLIRGENTANAMPDEYGLRGLVKRWYLSRIFAKSAGFLCIGSKNRQYYKERGISEDRLFYMPYAVDNDFFSERAKEAALRRDDFRKELCITSGRAVVLFAGKLQQRKHPRTLFEAWRALAGHRRPYLLYVGDGEERETLMSLSKDEPLVRVLGFRNQTELPAFYDLADIFVLAGEREAWGLAINEAMVSGTAIIASDQCGAAADLIDDATGALVPPGDASILTETLWQLLEDRQALSTMKTAATKKIAAWNFNEDLKGLKAALKWVCPTPPPA